VNDTRNKRLLPDAVQATRFSLLFSGSFLEQPDQRLHPSPNVLVCKRKGKKSHVPALSELPNRKKAHDPKQHAIIAAKEIFMGQAYCTFPPSSSSNNSLLFVYTLLFPSLRSTAPVPGERTPSWRIF
jgi:hypothetical protein